MRCTIETYSISSILAKYRLRVAATQDILERSEIGIILRFYDLLFDVAVILLVCGNSYRKDQADDQTELVALLDPARTFPVLLSQLCPVTECRSLCYKSDRCC